MVLRGQGDSPVRICEPCKKLEEAARFEMRYGHKGRAGKGRLLGFGIVVCGLRFGKLCNAFIFLSSAQTL